MAGIIVEYIAWAFEAYIHSTWWWLRDRINLLEMECYKRQERNHIGYKPFWLILFYLYSNGSNWGGSTVGWSEGSVRLAVHGSVGHKAIVHWRCESKHGVQWHKWLAIEMVGGDVVGWMYASLAIASSTRVQQYRLDSTEGLSGRGWYTEGSKKGMGLESTTLVAKPNCQKIMHGFKVFHVLHFYLWASLEIYTYYQRICNSPIL